MQSVDRLVLNFDPAAMAALNVIIAFVIFGVALDLRVDDFRQLFRAPRAFALGAIAQFVYMPAVTLALVWIIQPAPSIALGMFLVAACPGGNTSNFLTHYARGNLALSVSLTGVTTIVAVFATPFNFAFWSSFYPPAAALLRETVIETDGILKTVVVLLLMPIGVGMVLNAFAPRLAAWLRGPMRVVSLVIFGLFLVGALAANWLNFVTYIGAIALIVLVHNGIALAGGYAIAAAGGLGEPERRAIAIEAGIQNSGLGLALIFAFFGGLGGMALVAAWWGIWHLISGFALASWFRARSAQSVAHA